MSATTALAESANDANTSGDAAETPVTNANAETVVGGAADGAVATEAPAPVKSDEVVSAADAREQAGSLSYEAAERVRQSKLLPPALKERLAALVEASAAGPIEEAVRAVEEALPDFLLSQRQRGEQPEHPEGDSFFSGDPRELSDAEAERIAREQLARSGLLRGQRARMAD